MFPYILFLLRGVIKKSQVSCHDTEDFAYANTSVKTKPFSQQKIIITVGI